MEQDDKYIQMGFKCGIEIHQQLLTEKKLYCRCPAHYRNDEPDGEIIRHMRPTLSELGEYDGTALMEFKTKKNVVYQLYRENCCTYEMDDTPPFPINRDALEIAMKLAMLLNCNLVDELHVSRKQYLDGSIPTGFQRTAIVGVDGWVPYKDRKIVITHICLEEDACREVSDIGHEIVFRTDRLSMPLLEVITAPDMLTPKEAMEVDAIIGRLLKASGLVRRGIGSVRQDVNVSITGGKRAEIKGVPQTWMIEKLTANEAERQAGLLAIKEILGVRGINPMTIHGEKFELDGQLRDYNIPVVNKALEKGWVVRGIKMAGFAGIMSQELQPGKTFADEFSDRVRVIACLDQMPNIAVSDIPVMAGFNSAIWSKIKKTCDCKHTDVIIITWGSQADVNMALSEIKIRAIEATKGVPDETRQAFADGTAGFERVLPGPDRMYPDTDSPPVEITAKWVKKLRDELPEPAYKIEERWVKMGVPRQLAEKIVVTPYSGIFEEIISKLKLSPILVWSLLKNLDIADNQGIKILNGGLIELFGAFKKNLISKDSVSSILSSLNDNGKEPIEELIKKYKLLNLNDKLVQESIKESILETADVTFKKPDDRINYICGWVKKSLNGRIDGASLRDAVSKRISEK